MLEVPGHLHGNQIRRMLEVGGVDCNLFPLPQVSLRGAAGLGGGAAAIFRSVAVSPAVVPEGAQVVPALRSVTEMAGSNVSLQLCEFKDALLRLVIASAEGVVIRKDTETDTRSSKEKSHHQHFDSESSAIRHQLATFNSGSQEEDCQARSGHRSMLAVGQESAGFRKRPRRPRFGSLPVAPGEPVAQPMMDMVPQCDFDLSLAST